MKKIDVFNILGGMIIIFFGLSYLNQAEYTKSSIAIVVGIFLIIPAMIAIKKDK